jgi:hypothetical protein
VNPIAAGTKTIAPAVSITIAISFRRLLPESPGLLAP